MDMDEMVAVMAASIYGQLVKDYHTSGKLRATSDVIQSVRELAVSEANALWKLVVAR